MSTSEIEHELQKEFMVCPVCAEPVQTVCAEGVPAQQLRAGSCGHAFFMDLESAPHYSPEEIEP